MKTRFNFLAPAALIVLLLAAVTAQEDAPPKSNLPAELQGLEKPGDEAVVRRGDLALRVRRGDEPEQVTALYDGAEVALAPGILADLDRVAELPALWEQVPAAARGEARLAHTALLGTHLWAGDVLVTVDGVMTRAAATAPGTAGESVAAALLEAVAAVRAVAAGAGLPRSAAAALELSLAAILELPAAGGKAPEGDELDPRFVRGLVAHGWLAELLGDGEAVRTLQQQVAEALRPAPSSSYEAEDGTRWEAIDNLFGQRLEVLQRGTRSFYAMAAPAPAYFGLDSPLTLVAEVEPGAALDGDVEILSARTFDAAGRLLAGWSPRFGFSCDSGAWRATFPVREGAVSHALPPHVAVFAPLGGLLAIHTAHGTLLPPRGGDPALAERFLADAARALPDAAHLDLVGQYAFHYTFDSPDPSRPLLVGTAQVHGDIHQSAAQTLVHAFGGICRGDCDDLAEIYQEITRRQGKLSHIMEIPAHNALCWAELDLRQRWHVYVLQTGPGRETIADTLPEALAMAYGLFMGGAPFDADSIGISLRFAGENQRQGWYLGWRIFRDAEYAETMIDVQRDWHYKTYHRGIVKMRRLLEQGDLDPANYSELAGLCRSTAQWAQSARYHQVILDSYPDRTLHSHINALRMLYRAEDREQAAVLAADIIDGHLPRAIERLDEAAVDVVLQVAGTLAFDGKDYEAAARVLRRHLSKYLSNVLRNVLEWMNSDEFDAGSWNGSASALRLRGNLAVYTLQVATIRREAAAGVVPDRTMSALQGPAEQFLAEVALAAPEGSDDVARAYMLLGIYRMAIAGRVAFLEELRTVELPAAPAEHDVLKGEPKTRAESMQWIKASVPFWSSVLGDYVDEDAVSLDREAFEAAFAALMAANAAGATTGMQYVQLDAQLQASELLAAAVLGDREALRRHLDEVGRLADKRRTDAAVDILGGCARFLDVKWFAEVLDMWAEEVDTKPSYFGIAWEAWLHKAPEHAMLAARRATLRFPDEPAFVEELEFIEKLKAGDPTIAAEHAVIPAPPPVQHGSPAPAESDSEKPPQDEPVETSPAKVPTTEEEPAPEESDQSMPDHR